VNSVLVHVLTEKKSKLSYCRCHFYQSDNIVVFFSDCDMALLSTLVLQQ
jgi:hypothetical protein